MILAALLAVDPPLVAALALSGVIGVSLGLLGGGGSILAVPVLVYVARVEAREAIVMSLAIVGATSLLAGVLHGRAGRVNVRAAVLFGGAGVMSAPLGARLTGLLTPALLMVLFAVLMIVVGSLMLRRRPERLTVQAGRGGARVAPVLAAGLGVGALTGFLGVGGGFLMVPALVLLARLPMKTAVGTSLVVIAVNSAAAFAAHVGHSGVDLRATAAFTAAAGLGAIVGQRLAGRWPPEKLRAAFGVLVIVLGAFLAVRNAFEI